MKVGYTVAIELALKTALVKKSSSKILYEESADA